nr:response regulator [Granulicella aggregans]
MARRDDTSSAGHRILCVDDDLVCLQLCQTLLESNGYTVIISDRPFEALKQDFDAVDLAFVDYDMPEMNGRELLLRMRASNATFPIVLLSGQAYTLPFEVRVLFSACIDKGSPVREMLEIIERFRTQGDVEDWG